MITITIIINPQAYFDTKTQGSLTRKNISLFAFHGQMYLETYHYYHYYFVGENEKFFLLEYKSNGGCCSKLYLCQKLCINLVKGFMILEMMKYI